MINISDIYKKTGLSGIHKKRVFHLALLLLAGVVAYANSLHVPYILDDHYSIEYNGKMGLLDHLLHGSTRRVADITFALDYRIHGMQVTGYHLTNLAIHLSTTILLYFTMLSAISALRISFVEREQPTDNSRFAEEFFPFAVALLFVLHPVQTQAVTYIIQRYTSLATFFYLLAVLCYVRARFALEINGLCRSVWLYSFGVFGAGLLALGSKPIAVTLPFMLISLEYVFFKGRLINRRFYTVCGLFLMGCSAALLYKYHGSSFDAFLYDLRHQTSEDLFTTRTTYFLTQTCVIVRYLGLLCLPLGQSLVHETPVYSSALSVPVAASLALHSVVILSALIILGNSGRNLQAGKWACGAFQRLTACGIFWFYIAMSVESSIFPIRDVMFEHRVYLPSMGFFMTISAGIALFAQGKRSGFKISWSLLALYSLLLGGMTIARNHVWSDSLTLWQDASRKAPNKWLAQANLAGEYLNRNMPEKALPLLVRALELNPNLFIQTKVSLGAALKALRVYDSRFTTGSEYVVSGGPFGSGSLDYKNLSKWEGVISNNMGLAYEYMKEPEKAMRAYKMSVTTDPKYDLAWYNLALLAKRTGDKWLVDMAFEQLKVLNPALAGSLESGGI